MDKSKCKHQKVIKAALQYFCVHCGCPMIVKIEVDKPVYQPNPNYFWHFESKMWVPNVHKQRIQMRP